MKTTLISLVFLITTSLISFSQTAKDIAKYCLPSTVSLIMEDEYRQPLSLGSGFIISKGLIVTNLHVIEGAKFGHVIVNGSSTKHKIEGYSSIDKQNDLAILSVPTITEKPLALSHAKAEIGEKIYAIGNPKGLSGTISEGIISGIRNLEDTELIQITAPISPGSSGGPVIGNSGMVIGVAVGTLSSGQNLNFAIPSDIVKSLINESMGMPITKLNISKGATAPKSEESQINIEKGLYIRNIEWEIRTSVLDNEPPLVKKLKGFSFKNDLPYRVSQIKVLFIVYDESGVPIDYYQRIYLNCKDCNDANDGIKPYLAKYIDFFPKARAFRCENEDERIEIRILDFKIHDN